MTVREQGLRASRRAARAMLKRWGVEKAEDIHVEAMARAEGITIVEGPLRGARGRLSAGPRPVIRIADDMEGARRFTVAHELAHHFLKHPASSETACGVRDLAKAPDTSVPDYEAEANAFATELLMPRNLVSAHVANDRAPTLEIPRAIALEFATSIPASAIRYVQLTNQRCAAVYSELGTIRWASRSHRFAARLPRQVPLSNKSYAYECAATQDHDDRPREIEARVWLATDEPISIVEHSAPVSEVGGVITLLWVPEAAASRLWSTHTQALPPCLWLPDGTVLMAQVVVAKADTSLDREVLMWRLMLDVRN